MTAVIAMDLGAHDFKLVQLEEGRLTRHASVPLSDPGFIDGIPTPELSATVKRTLQSGGFTAQVVRVAIPDSGIAVRDFPLPAVARRDLRSAVTFEGRRLVPMNASDVYYAWHATKTSYGYGVYLVAARRDMVDAYEQPWTAFDRHRRRRVGVLAHGERVHTAARRHPGA